MVAFLGITMGFRVATLLFAALACTACGKRNTPTPSATATATATTTPLADASASPRDLGLEKAMADFQAQRAADGRLAPSELYSLPDDRLATELWRRLELKEQAGALSASELAIVCVMNVDAEVNNGGFDQFFFNSSGDHASETGPALRRVGLADVADLYDRALKGFPGTPLQDTGARREQMRSVPRETERVWSELDLAYYKLKVDVVAAVARFARSHPKDIAP
jgi:hypothetical protein